MLVRRLRLLRFTAQVFNMFTLFNIGFMPMLGVRLEPELEKRLAKLAKVTGRSKSYYAKEAIRQFLEDREDYLLGLAALEKQEPTLTIREVKKRLGLGR